MLSGKRVVSIYFGGGTPTLFAPKGIALILDVVRQSGLGIAPRCEITIEANPEDSSAVLFRSLLALGVNRLSLGVQSLDDRSLQTLERTHSAQKAVGAIQMAQGAGFENISIDLMYDLPEQNASSWDYTLAQLKDLQIQHLSLYNLTIEPHTTFYKRRNELVLPSSKMSLYFLQTAIQRLEEIGLRRYEISAFSGDGFQSVHNKGYWTARPFLGFGPSAFSYWGKERFRNVAHLQRYARALREGNSPVDFRERLENPRDLKELLAVHLRLLEGVDLACFGTLPAETMASLEKWVREGGLVREGDRVRLTERGALLYDAIAEDVI